MTAPILHTVFHTFNRHQRHFANDGQLSLIKVVSTPYNIHGSDSTELMRISSDINSQVRLGSALALAISRDINALLTEYEADADRLHQVFQAAGAVRLDDANIHIDSIYMRPPVEIDTSYVLVGDKSQQLVLLTMPEGLTHISPDQVEISVRRALAKQDSLPRGNEQIRHPVQDILAQYTGPMPQTQQI